MSRSRINKLLSATTGQEIAEAAIVIPLLFMILLGIYWFGRVFNIYGTISHAAREGARAGIQPCASCAQLSNAAIEGQVASAITNALQASHVDPSQARAPGPPSSPINPTPVACPGTGGSCNPAVLLNGGPGKVEVCRSVQLNAGSAAPPLCGIVVGLQYPYQFWFPFTSLNRQKIWVEATAQSDGEN